MDVVQKYKTSTYERHKCSPSCCPYNLLEVSELKDSPFMISLIFGFRRKKHLLKDSSQLDSNKPVPLVIRYVAPCGRSLPSLSVVHCYLSVSRSPTAIDCFSFEVRVPSLLLLCAKSECDYRSKFYFS
jgi:hypothetical protein